VRRFLSNYFDLLLYIAAQFLVVFVIYTAFQWFAHTVHAYMLHMLHGWLRGTVVERWSLTSELSLSCARPAADG